MDRNDGTRFDCDDHGCEAADAFARHAPRWMRRRCVRRNTAALGERRAA